MIPPEHRRHMVYRSFTALARAERFEPSRYTNDELWRDIEWMDAGELPRIITLCYDLSVRAERVMRERWGFSDEQVGRAVVFTPPSLIGSLLIAYALRRCFPTEWLSSTPGFTGRGLFHIRPSVQMVQPVIRDGLYKGFRFYNWKGDLIYVQSE